jgi:hypothetical protein
MARAAPRNDAILNRMSQSPDQRHVLLLADRTRDIGQITAAVARGILESRQLFAILKTCRIVSAVSSVRMRSVARACPARLTSPMVYSRRGNSGTVQASDSRGKYDVSAYV